MASIRSAFAAALSVVVFSLAGPAVGNPMGERRLNASDYRDPVFGADVVPTLAPFAHVLFCKQNPAECKADGRGREPLAATAELMQTIQRVNLEVNRTIRPKPDAAGPLGDVWSLSPARGDCDDFVVTKRHRLRQAGLPISALRVAVTRTAGGEGHAVLIVSTDKGNLVLDNRFGKILPWNEARLQMVKLQSADDPQRWFATNDRVAEIPFRSAEMQR